MATIRPIVVPFAAVIINIVLLSIGNAAGFFDGVTASSTGEPVTNIAIAFATLFAVAALYLLGTLMNRFPGGVRGRRLFLFISGVVLVLSFGTPLTGLDDSTSEAIIILQLAHIVTVAGGVIAARPTEPFEDATSPSVG